MTLNDPLDPGKCHGREDLRCQEMGFGYAVCIPICGSDGACEDRFCDPELTVCVDYPEVGGCSARSAIPRP
jgi:hypothetical protein